MGCTMAEKGMHLLCPVYTLPVFTLCPHSPVSCVHTHLCPVSTLACIHTVSTLACILCTHPRLYSHCVHTRLCPMYTPLPVFTLCAHSHVSYVHTACIHTVSTLACVLCPHSPVSCVHTRLCPVYTLACVLCPHSPVSCIHTCLCPVYTLAVFTLCTKVSACVHTCCIHTVYKRKCLYSHCVHIRSITGNVACNESWHHHSHLILTSDR